MKISNVDNLKIVKTDLEQLKIDFDCGDEDLNEFLLKDSFKILRIIFAQYFYVSMKRMLLDFFHYLLIRLKSMMNLKFNILNTLQLKLVGWPCLRNFKTSILEV